MARTDAPRPAAELLIEGAAEVLTVPASGGLGVVAGGVVAIAAGRVVAVGDRRTVEAEVDLSGADVLDAGGGVIAPGYVDAHTHVVFGGSRADEYSASVARDRAQLARLQAAGRTGIWATVDATRATRAEALLEQSAARVRAMVRSGTTTIESKSGYGLDRATEIIQLEVNRAIARSLPIRVVSTYLGAHVVPRGVDRDRHVGELIHERIPEVAELGLATFCDVWCDEGAFTLEEARGILEAGVRAGLRPKLHLDQYTHTGAAAVAADLGAVSADHLDHTPPADARRLADAGVTGVLMPGIDFAVAHPHPFDARMLIGEGLPIGLATDICPGCWMPSMTLAIQLGCRLHGLSPEEAIRAATRGAARAVGLEGTVGSLEPGAAADLQVWDLPDHRHLAYRLGVDPVRLVVATGRVVFDRRAEGLPLLAPEDTRRA